MKNFFSQIRKSDQIYDLPTQPLKDAVFDQNVPPSNHASQKMKRGAQKNSSQSSSKNVHKQHNNSHAPVQQKSKQPSNQDQSVLNRQSDLIRQQEKERYQKKILRRQIYKSLEDLHTQGSACEVNTILSFIQSYSDAKDLVRDALTQFGFKDTFPINMIWISISHTYDNTPDTLLQALEAHKQTLALIQQRDRLAAVLSSSLKISVPTTEDGPEFTSLTADQIHACIEEHFKENLSPFNISASFPFLHRGDYALLLDFSQNITLSLTLHLQGEPDVLPDECLHDFTGI